MMTPVPLKIAHKSRLALEQRPDDELCVGTYKCFVAKNTPRNTRPLKKFEQTMGRSTPIRDPTRTTLQTPAVRPL